MLVSNFTLGFNNWYEFDTGWTSVYELQVTNLAEIEITFDVEWRVTSHYFGGVDERKEPVTKSLETMLYGSWYKDLNGYYSQYSKSIGPNESYKFQLGTWLYQGREWTPYVDGYAVLRVPVVRSPQPPYGLVPQSKTAIPVLLNAIRTQTWIKRFEPRPPNLVTSSQSSFPLASGKALNDIPPETAPYRHPFAVHDYIDAIINRKIAPARGVLGLPDEDRVQAAIDLLSQMTKDESDLGALNRMLEDLGSAVRVVESDTKHDS